MKTSLNNLTLEELVEWLKSVDQPSYRARQIQEWICRKFAVSAAEMKNLPASLREALEQNFLLSCCSELKSSRSGDGTEKLLLGLLDGECVECVIIPAKDGRTTFCLSSQVGCPVGCRFCASGMTGFTRNLDASEILGEFFICCRKIGHLPDNIVFMGTGEPLMNYSNLIGALGVICDEKRVGMSPRRITVSTSGFVPGIMKLADEGRPWNLAVSLHSSSDKGRAALIPEKHRYPIKEICEACEYYFNATGRIVTFEYALMKGMNDSENDARELAMIAGRCSAKVNLIPFNPVEKTAFLRPDNSQIRRFEAMLRGLKIPVTVRVEKGDSINAACGQLRISHMGE